MPGDRNSASRCSGETNDAGQMPPRLLRAAELYRWAAERVGTGGIDGQNLRKTAFNTVLAGVAIMLPRRYPISWMARNSDGYLGVLTDRDCITPNNYGQGC